MFRIVVIGDEPDAQKVPSICLIGRFVAQSKTYSRPGGGQSPGKIGQHDILMTVPYEQYVERTENLDQKPARPSFSKVGPTEVFIGEHAPLGNVAITAAWPLL